MMVYDVQYSLVHNHNLHLYIIILYKLYKQICNMYVFWFR